MDHEWGGLPRDLGGRHHTVQLIDVSRSEAYGVYTVGLGAVGIPLPMKKLVCGGWL
jgi:hypothetical protein